VQEDDDEKPHRTMITRLKQRSRTRAQGPRNILW
jgi:hypothetical protein